MAEQEIDKRALERTMAVVNAFGADDRGRGGVKAEDDAAVTVQGQRKKMAPMGRLRSTDSDFTSYT